MFSYFTRLFIETLIISPATTGVTIHMNMIATICSSLSKVKPPGLKFFRNKISSKISPREYKEVEINVPWGKITGKHWGPTDVQPIIAIHGWQDNAASFDPLMNYMPEKTSILAIDLPGHGYSSWIPNGFMYNMLFYEQTVERIRQHYGMDEIALIGHSMGGMISFKYASDFPERMKFVVALDYFKFPSFNESKHRFMFAKQWNNFFSLEKSWTTVPRYNMSDAIQRSIEATSDSLNETTCKILYSRGTAKHPDGTISFIRDPRVRFLMIENAFTHDHLKLLAARMKFPYRILKGANSEFNESMQLYFDVMKVIELHSNDFKYHLVPGTHHFHMDNPQAVADILTPFIEKNS